MVNSLKKLSFSIAITAVFVVFSQAEDYAELIIGPFGTLNNEDNSLSIPSSQAQDLLNVDISPGGKSIKKRKGYGLAYALTITTSPTHGVYNFRDSSGNDVALSFHDSYMTAVINGGTPANIFTNGPNGATYQCTDNDGFAYCADSTRSKIVKTNGATSSSLVIITTGTMVTNTQSRLVQAGFSSFPNRIDFSKANDFTVWTVGSAATDPIQFTVASPGEKITHIVYAFNRLMWFKSRSFGYILEAPELADWVVKTISPVVGTLDNSSVYWNGILYFRGQDSHLYAFDGSNLQKLSREINQTILLTQNRQTNSSIQTSQADFGTGLIAPAVYLDTITAAGSVTTTFPDSFGSYRDGTSGTKLVWSEFESTAGISTPTASGGYLVVNITSGTLARGGVRSQQLESFQQGTTFHVRISSMDYDTAGTTRFLFTLSTQIVSAPSFPDQTGTYWTMDFRSTTSARVYLAQVANSQADSISSTTGSYAFPLEVDLWIATTAYSYSLNGTVIKSGSHTWPNNQIYAYLLAMRGNAVTSGGLKIDVFGVAPTTSTYDSPVVNASALTNWDTLNVTAQNNSGTHTFYMRSAMNPFTIGSSTPSWSSVTNGAIPSIATGTYFQFRDLITGSTWTATPSLDDFTISWFEGSATDKSYMTYFDDAVWFSVAYGSAATNNNRILRFDLINNGWTIYDIPVNGFYARNLHLYFGHSTSGNVFKYGDVNSDNGLAINAYWKSKDIFTLNPFIENDFRNYSLSSNSVANSSMTVTYTLNGSSSTSFTVPLYTANSSFTKNNKNLPLGKNGLTFNTQVGNNAVDQPFEVFMIRVGYVPKPWVAK